MSSAALMGWIWYRSPDAHIADGKLLADADAAAYVPGENQESILNALLRVRDDDSAIQFAQQWGLLGLARTAPWRDSLEAERIGALRYAWNKWKRKHSDASDKGFAIVMKEVDGWFRNREDVRLSGMPDSEPVAWMLDFAERMRLLAEVARIRSFYSEDPPAADYEARQWAANLGPERHQELVGMPREALLEVHTRRVGYGAKRTEPSFDQFLLVHVLDRAQMAFSHPAQRGIWVELAPGDGRPVFEFDGLFRFIEYCVLSGTPKTSKRCKDPKCGQPFFPIRRSAKYCPSPIPGKRSRCEQRHHKELERAEKAAEKAKGNE